MAQVQIDEGGRAIQGASLFLDETLDPKVEAWRQIVYVFNLSELIASLEMREPGHPLVVAIRPVLLESSETLEKEAAGYYNLITSSELEENLRATLQDVFVSWLEQRFSDKSKQEIEMLLLGALPDLRETRSGKDLIYIDWLEGREEGREEEIDEGERLGNVKSFLMLLDAKFETVSPEIRERVAGLESAEVDKMLLQWVSADSIDQMRW